MWTDTVESHRQEVREAVLDAAGEVAASRGVLAVSMSQVAAAAGIGRATLYKYFADAEEVLAAWHARQVAAHLAELTALAAGSKDPAARLRSVLEQYARICQQQAQHGGDAITAALHRAPDVHRQERQLQDLVAGLLADAASSGAVRTDVPAGELASFCLHALTAAGDISRAAPVNTLVKVVWAGLTPSGGTGG